MKKKIPLSYTFSVGFTIFATFFGAGNLIFPPYLGLTNGGSWIWAFFSYIVMDAGLASIAVIAVSRYDGDSFAMAEKLGKLGTIIIFLEALCLGPLAAVPRTAAVTFELAVHPHFPGLSSWVVSFVYFALAGLLCLKPSKVVDIVGSFMTPILLAGLMILIIKGIFSPVHPLAPASAVSSAVREGLVAGYQTMDMLGACLLSTVLIASVAEKNYDFGERTKIFFAASIIAAGGLFIVYGGLAYLGSVSGMDPSLSNADILVGIVKNNMGNAGLYILSVVVTLACLTTGIGLVSSCSHVFSDFTGGKVSYLVFVVLNCIAGFLVANLGIESILAIASPVLELIYPGAILIVITSFFKQGKANKVFSRFSVCCATAVTVWSLLDSYIPADLGFSRLPLAGAGLAWVIPSVICGALGVMILNRCGRNGRPDENR